jgi:hypothetical protein
VDRRLGQFGSSRDRIIGCPARPLELIASVVDRGQLPAGFLGYANDSSAGEHVEQRAPNPPHGIGRELGAAPVVEPFDGPD